MKIYTRVLFIPLLILLFSVVFSNQSNAQSTLLTESFENAGNAPVGWATEVVSGGNTISFQMGTAHPAGFSAYNGSYQVMFNSYSGNSGVNRLKRTSAFSTIGYTNVTVDFAWLESYGFATSPDKVEVQWSTDGTNWNTAGTFYRYNAVQGWKIKSQLLPAGAQGQNTLYIAFLFTSNYGNDCYLDYAHIIATNNPPPGM
ncbi:MAG: choice-of-anchor J domain-containing protein, partial [Bacteroidota bacterium]